MNAYIFSQQAILSQYLNQFQKVRQGAIEFAVSEGILMYDRDCVSLANHNSDFTEAVFHVKSLRENRTFSVKFKFNKTCTQLTIDSNDPHSHLPVSSPRYAAALAFRAKLKESINFDQRDTALEMNYINIDYLSRLSGRQEQSEALKLIKENKVHLIRTDGKMVEANVAVGRETHKVVVKKVDKNNFNTSCTCAESGFPVCTHKFAVFYALFMQYGEMYFDQQRDWTEEKNRLLAAYGFTVEDDIAGKFDFKLTGGKLELILLDKSIQKLSNAGNWTDLKKRLLVKAESKPEAAPMVIASPLLKNDTALGFAFYLEMTGFPFFSIIPFSAKLNDARSAFKSNYTELSPHTNIIDFAVSDDEKAAMNLLRNLTTEHLLNYLAYRRNPKFNKWEDPYYHHNVYIEEEEKPIIMRYVHQQLTALWPILAKHPYVFESYSTHVSKSGLRPLTLNPLRFRPYFRYSLIDDFAVLEAFIIFIDPAKPDPEHAIKKPYKWVNGLRSPLFALEKPKTPTLPIALSLIENFDDAQALDAFGPDGEIKVHKSDAAAFFKHIVLPLKKQYAVELPDEFQIETRQMDMTPAVFLNEAEEAFLVIKPLFQYGELQAEYDRNDSIVLEEDDKIIAIERNLEQEQTYYDFIKNLHPSFEEQAGAEYFYLPFELATQQNWFFDFYDQMNQRQIPIFGYAKLQKFKYNPNRPTFNMKFSSGVDWFDVSIELAYGDQIVKLKDLKKAILKKQNYIQLGDGSIGMLPQEWLEKYSMLFRMGQQSKNGLRLSKYHFTVIDELYEQIDDIELQQQLTEKRNRLASFDKIEDVALPQNVQATLRPYQIAAFNWMNFLDSVKWGGCLADDMGLGKTLQTLTFLQHLKNTRPQATHLVVAPRTLLFNWENEIQKFTPSLTFFIHHGLGRPKNSQEFHAYDLILTTYGTLRSDIEIFNEFPFHYIVLDESQAIKNPTSQIAKAVQTLKADNRLILTGTPVQNNTFELYTQMNFLNPGLLGAMEFFKEEYAAPIDRDEDVEKAKELKRLIFPFMLRRTKEQVAPDLPEKTEMILFCEMGARQRKIYNTFRDEIRDNIMGKLKEDPEAGLGNAGMYVLQGLMKLRQICDSPALLPDEGDFGSESVKLDELMRELGENIGNHKALVFSQFVGMLGLIRMALEKEGISYEYLDGQTRDRKACVERFQNDDSVRVFLISLTAGGVGLNLTAADYVYIVDPWWNPAVEQQAIDRTHRIGQHKNIFAYKMICKDTIEEKIVLLQQKKKKLADDLIADDSGFVKKLTREDLEYLFS